MAEEKSTIENSIKAMRIAMLAKFGNSITERFEQLTPVDQITFFLGFATGSACGRIEGVSEFAERLMNKDTEK